MDTKINSVSIGAINRSIFPSGHGANCTKAPARAARKSDSHTRLFLQLREIGKSSHRCEILAASTGDASVVSSYAARRHNRTDTASRRNIENRSLLLGRCDRGLENLAGNRLLEQALAKT